MAKFMLVYHGGGEMPADEAEQAEMMAAWNNWFGSLGGAVIDGGCPVGQSKTVHSDGSVTDHGGANPVTGYSFIEAADYEDAVAKAKGCPMLDHGGTVELAQAMEM